MRTPGAVGVNVTDSVQVVTPAVSCNPGTHEGVPLPTVKSCPLAPIVNTSTVLTAPAACAVTVTLCGADATPTATAVLKTPFCAHALALTSSKAARAGIQLRLRLKGRYVE
jgi:hypothetical protein